MLAQSRGGMIQIIMTYSTKNANTIGIVLQLLRLLVFLYFLAELRIRVWLLILLRQYLFLEFLLELHQIIINMNYKTSINNTNDSSIHNKQKSFQNLWVSLC